MKEFTVREIQTNDVDHIADYWLKSDKGFLQTLGVDFGKLPIREDLVRMITSQIDAPYKSKKSYAIIWELNGVSCGHCNVNEIVFREKASMHLHMWQSKNRMKGAGSELVKMSIPYFFEKIELDKIVCEPYSLNIAPHKTIEKLGFTFIKEYTCIPGSLSFEQSVKRWELSKKDFLKWKS